MRREGEIVLIYFMDQPGVFARIESIEPDIKKDWYHVTLLMLTIPPQPVVWILKEAYIDGAPFTMGEKPLRLEEVKTVLPEDVSGLEEGGKAPDVPGKVLPFKKP